MTDKRRLKTSAGELEASIDPTQTAGARGPIPLRDDQVLESLAHQSRERIPIAPPDDGRYEEDGSRRLTRDPAAQT